MVTVRAAACVFVMPCSAVRLSQWARVRRHRGTGAFEMFLLANATLRVSLSFGTTPVALEIISRTRRSRCPPPLSHLS